MKSGNILDLKCSTNDGLISNVNTDPELSTSDHRIVSFNINLKGNVSEKFIFIYRKGNLEEMRKNLGDTDCGVVDNETDVNKSWEKLL